MRSTAILLAVLAVAATMAFPYNEKDYPEVMVLSQDTFQPLVIQSPNLVMIEFYIPKCKDCKKFAEDYRKVARALEGLVTVTAVNGASEEGKQIAASIGVQQFPTLLLFPSDLTAIEHEGQKGYMKMPQPYQGARNADDVVKWAIAQMPGSQVQRIEDAADHYEFVKKWENEGIVKILLFSEYDMSTPQYKGLALEYKYSLLFGRAVGDEMAALYNVKQRPALFAVTADGESTSFDGDANNLADLHRWLKNFALLNEARNRIVQLELKEREQEEIREKQAAQLAKAKTPLIVKEDDVFRKSCVGAKAGICIVTMIDNAYDEAAMAPHVDMLYGVAKKIVIKLGQPVQPVIIDGSSNYRLAEYFNLNAGFPAVTFIKPAVKQRFNLIGSFSDSGLFNYYSTKVATGRGVPYDLKKMPSLVEPPRDDTGSRQDEDELVFDE